METSTLHASVVAILVESGEGIRLGDNAARTSETRIAGAYDTIMRAAAEAGDWPTFESACKELFEGIRKNVTRDDAENGLAVLFGAQHGKDKDGKATDGYTVPHSLSRAKTVIKKAFDNNVAVVDAEGNPRTFGAVRDENKEIAKDKRDAADAEALAVSMADLSGDTLLRAEVQQALSLIIERANVATGTELVEIHSTVMILSGMAEAPEQSTGEQLTAAAASG